MIYSTKRLSSVFKALSNERRMLIIKLLARKSRSVIDVSMALKVSFKSASFHLLKLEREGVVEKDRQGKFNYYKLTNSFKGSGIFRQIVKSK
jgi:DNA-binding transcriptional ArsR family regulator